MVNTKEQQTAKDKDGKQKKKLCFTVENGKQIQDQAGERRVFLVDGVITPGLNLLAAPIKKKKSFWALHLALCVAGREDFMGRKTEHGKVLYFALEDDRRRVGGRVNTLLDYDDAPEDLLVSYATEFVGDDFFGDLEIYLEEEEGIKLVIIDVMQKIRSGVKSGQSEYAHDYDEIGRLKKIADKYGISLLAVTHTKKGRDAKNRLNEISGGVGVPGAADTILMLQDYNRHGQDGTGCGDGSSQGKDERILSIIGRDVAEVDWIISFNPENCRCEYIGSLQDKELRDERKIYASSPVVKTIRSLLEKQGGTWTGTCSELLECGLRETGQHIAKSESALSRKINQFDRLLLAEDSIQHIKPDPNGGTAGRIHTFIQKEKPAGVPEMGGGTPKGPNIMPQADGTGTDGQEIH